ncbi:TATA-binding protein-associated factor mot1 [Coemansia sp. RSA 1358]|uniref:TATA-binding protein-associated factor mot1 n=1 Tax=Coemansia umbellata TaxID=1424467 RepID=A0ABQ8PRW2_9FUNG|nr:TATA-binding protein-associated factor mot1 [Coemansia umbellata]KAJ2624507.1 TATA-binding protein-associated factor mot1 [Coemansia sp. RSA 1358]
MATRLDRLVALLDTGATPLVRSTAARQIGGIQKQHPEELFRLLARVYDYIGSKSWDTRIAAAQAFEAIAKEVSEWDPNAQGTVKIEDIKPPTDDDLLTFEQFNVDSVIKHGRLLLGSAGCEYEDDGLAGLDPQARIAVQRAQMKKRLGLGAQFLDDDLLDDIDLGADDTVGTNKATPRGRKRKSEPDTHMEPKREEASEPSQEIYMNKLSARERNRLKRKARTEGKKKAKVDLGPKKNGSTPNTPAEDINGPIISQSAVDMTEQPGGEAIVVEAKRADNREALFAISEGSWPFESLVDILCIDLFDPAWEVRHGAGMALREIFKHHGYYAGRAVSLSSAENNRRNQRFLEDICVRLLCVFTLDRFGDFVSDHVVAPVRETCAQTLGVVSQFLTQPLLVATQQALLQLVGRGAGYLTAASGADVAEQTAALAPIWEARHSGLSGLRYIVAVRRDMAPLLVMGTLDAALTGLQDHDDDVRSVSAEALLPLVDTMVTCQPTRILDVINGVWAALIDLGDDLTASVASVMDLLARLFSHPQVRAAVIGAGQHNPEKYAFSVLIPRLYPFFRHTIVGVRRATVQALLTFASMQAEGIADSEKDDHMGALKHNVYGVGLLPATEYLKKRDTSLPPWVDTACLRLVFQNMVLETNPEILELSAKLWVALLRQCREQACQSADGAAEDYVQLLMPGNVLSAMLRFASTPIGIPMTKSLIYDPRVDASATSVVLTGNSDNGILSTRYNVDRPMIQQDMGLISRETIMQCRVQAAAALGLLVAAWPASSRPSTFAGLLSSALRSGWSLQCQLAAVVVEEFVMAERTDMFSPSLYPDAQPASTANSENPMSRKVSFSTPEFVDQMLGILSAILGGEPTPPMQRGLAYYDLQRSLAYVHSNCKVLLGTICSEGKLAESMVPKIPELDSAAQTGSSFTIDTAMQVCNEVFDQLLAQISPRTLNAHVKSTLAERQQRLKASIEYYRHLQQQLEVSTNAALAGSIIAIGRLPAKLNNILRSVMAAIKLESSELLQRRAAEAVSRMAALCYCAEDPPRSGPADKMVKNLATFACSDPWTTPVFAQRARQEESILMLEMVQREQVVGELQQQHQQQQQKKNGINGMAQSSKGNGNNSNALMAAAASASAQASQRKRRGKVAKTAEQPADEEIPLVQTSNLTEEQEKEQAAKLIVRGAENAIAALAHLFCADLMRYAPKLWECISVPLIAAYGPAPDADVANAFGNGNGNGTELSICNAKMLTGTDAEFANEAAAFASSNNSTAPSPASHAQSVIDALRILLTLAPSLDLSLHSYLVSSLPWVMSALMSRFSAVRHIAARTMAELCRVIKVEAMQALVQNVLPSLGDTTLTHRRQGVAEAIYYIIQRLDEEVLPYVTFLMVPVLGRMSDSNEQTRLVCTNCFAQLLKLVPLEADIPDPKGISEELIAKREHERKFLAQLMDSSKLEPFKIPVKVNATLRKYQQEGVDWLAFLNKYELHGVLCDDMGLGKTLQTICIIASDHHLRKKKFMESQGLAADCQPLPSLVVCPPTLISHWEQEIKQFTENLRPLCYAGPPTERRPLIPRIAANDADVVIMSYDVVRNDIELLANQNWNYCVLDEGHCIKNAKTKLTQAVKRVHARRRLILSGTPVQNNVIELWSLFDFLMPGFLGTERQFNEMYGKPILASRDAKQMSQAQLSGEQALKALHKQVLPFLLRRMKEDVLQDLPPKIIQDYYCELSPLQRFLYEEFAKSAVTGNLKKSLGVDGADQETESNGNAKEEKSAGNKPATHVFQALQYLRKLCNHPALVLSPKHPLYTQVIKDLGAHGTDLHTLDIAPKMLALKDLLNQCGIGLQSQSLVEGGKASTSDILDQDAAIDAVSASHRVLIFCQHKEMIERIEQDLFQRNMPGVTYMRVDGTVEARRRQDIVTRFNSDPSIDCLLLTTHVGGLGLNLTGADTVIFVEHDYNPAMDLQAMDRAHRLGQTRVVNVYRLITRNTLEEKIMGLQAFKLHMANTIVNQQNAGLSSMNTDQLLDLFNISPPSSGSNARDTSGTTASATADGAASGGSKSISRALEGLEELWDTSQYEDEYNLDNFISSLQQ